MRDTEAANWLMRMQGEDVPQAEMEAWLDWCRADPRNLDAFERYQSLYEGLRVAGYAVRKDFLLLAEQADTETATQGFTARAWWLAASSLAAAVCGVALLLWTLQPSPPVDQAQYRAERGRQRDLTLADNSRVVLASDSMLSSQYSAARRLLKLERGEAYFEVEADPGRPFVVDAGFVVATATGSAFNVRRTSERVVVSVTEGAVEVTLSAAKSPAPEPLHLQAGKEAVYADFPDARVVVNLADRSAVLARQRGYLLYDNEPLGSVLDDVNRYAPNPIVATDATLRAMRFTGSIYPEEIEGWVQKLEMIFPVHASRREDGSIVLEALPSVAK